MTERFLNETPIIAPGKQYGKSLARLKKRQAALYRAQNGEASTFSQVETAETELKKAEFDAARDRKALEAAIVKTLTKAGGDLDRGRRILQRLDLEIKALHALAEALTKLQELGESTAAGQVAALTAKLFDCGQTEPEIRRRADAETIRLREAKIKYRQLEAATLASDGFRGLKQRLIHCAANNDLPYLNF